MGEDEECFLPELERSAYRAGNGEFGWTREQTPQVIGILRAHAMAILGGELWYVKDGRITPSVPQREGPSALYCWSTERDGGESWPSFVEHGATDALAAAERWPEPGELPPSLPGQILCNLSLASEAEFEDLRRQHDAL
ncbi:MAG: hypothetical protein WBQ34_02345 [Candidatus Acidiferrales bacterium]